MFRMFLTILFAFFCFVPTIAQQNSGSEPLMNLTHTPGDLNVDIFNDGSIGHDNATATLGVGVTWKGIDGCFVGGPLFGTANTMSVNGNIGSARIQDIKNVSSNFAGGFMSDPDFDQITEAILNDSLAPSPFGVEITQKTYSNTGDEFLFIRYGFKNTTGSTLAGCVGGIFVDWDINDLSTNSGGYALGNNVCYQFGTDPGDYYYGLASMDGASGMRVCPPGFPIKDSSYVWITTFDPNITPNYDFGSWIGTLLGDIAPGETVWATFAVVAGDNVIQLTTNALYANLQTYAIGWTNLLLSGTYPWTEPSVADFGDIQINTSENFTIILFNLGTDDLIISNIASSVGPFTLESNFNYPITLSTLESVEVEVVFSPAAAGDYDEILTITSNESGFEGFHLNGYCYEMSEAYTDIFYASTGSGNNGDILTVSRETGAGTTLGNSLFAEITSLSVNPNNNIIYGLISGHLSSQIIRVNAGQGDAYNLFDLEIPKLSGIAFDNTGILYASQQTGEIYTIDLADGNYAIVDTTDIEINAIAFHPTTNELWAAIRKTFGAGKDSIYTIELPSGIAIPVGVTGFGVMTNDLAFDEEGKLYGVTGTSNQEGTLFEIGTVDGSGTMIGYIGFNHVVGLGFSINGPVISVEGNGSTVPEEHTLKQNYPNPFNPVTTIKYGVREISFVELRIYDVLGREVYVLVNEEQNAGFHKVNFNAEILASGIYFYRLQAVPTGRQAGSPSASSGQSFIETKKMVLLR